METEPLPRARRCVPVQLRLLPCSLCSKSCVARQLVSHLHRVYPNQRTVRLVPIRSDSSIDAICPLKSGVYTILLGKPDFRLRVSVFILSLILNAVTLFMQVFFT